MRDRDPYAGYDPFRLHVFVPAIMSAGLVFSLLTLVRDAFAGRNRRSAHRRASVAASGVVADVLRLEPTPAEIGLRPRRFYLLVAVGAGAAAAYLAPGALLNYAHDGGYVSDIAWLLGTSLIVAILAVAAACVAGATWWRWPDPPGWARRAISATPLSAPPRSAAADGGGGADPLLGAAVLATYGAFAVVALGVGAARGSFARLDERLLETVVRWDVPEAAERLATLGSTRVAIVVALFVGATTVRCRTFAASWVLAVSGTLAVDAAVKTVVNRPRPDGSVLSGLAESFPSGHVAQAALLAMAVPLAARIVSKRRWPGTVTGTVLVAAAVVTAIARVHGGTHWPTDVIGGALLGAAAGMTLRWAVAHGEWHAGCRGCPWRAPGRVAGPHGRRLLPVSPRLAKRLRRAAALWLVAVVAVLLEQAMNGGLPGNPEGGGTLSQIEVPAQLGLLALAVGGGLVGVRWPAVGATVLALVALGLGLLASVEHPVAVVVGVTVALAVPAGLLWLAWQHTRSLRSVALLAVIATSLLAAETSAANSVYNRFFGPAHPASTTAEVPVDVVTWAWMGDLRPDGVTVVLRLEDRRVGGSVVLHVEPQGGAATAVAAAVPDEDRIVRLRASGLAAGTAHRWWVGIDGRVDAGRGRGRFTTPPDGPASFTIAAGSCARTGSNGAVFDAIRRADPLLYVATGDLHYANLPSTDPGAFLGAYQRTLTPPAQAALYREVPVDYVWDDHDYGPNDADSRSPGREAARAAYRQAVPHPVLPSRGAIFHATTIGRVRVILTDTRSERTDQTMLGDEQLAWLLGELGSADRWGLVVWVNPDPWIAPAQAGRDDWGGYPDERRRIADAIAAAGVDNLVMISGDAHMLAVDDGTNSDYATSGGAGFPVLHAAALDRPGNVKGGPYSEGSYPGAGQFGLLRIQDDGTTVGVDIEGRDWTDRRLVHLRFTT
jgi:membrane-associated phospholipid phosphatase